MVPDHAETILDPPPIDSPSALLRAVGQLLHDTAQISSITNSRSLTIIISDDSMATMVKSPSSAATAARL